MRGIHVRGDNDWVYGERVDRTVEVNFAPSFVVAKVSISGVGGRHFGLAGIYEYRRRPTPAGAEERVSVRDWQPSHIWGDRISSVTFFRQIHAQAQDYFFLSVVSEIQFW